MIRAFVLFFFIYSIFFCKNLYAKNCLSFLPYAFNEHYVHLPQDKVFCVKNLKNKLQRTISGKVLLENTGNIGKNYRKHDEIGTPACITVDFQSLDDNTFTVRDRDSMQQERVSLEEIRHYLEGNYEI